MYIHTRQNHALASHTTYVVCRNIINENDRFLRNFFMTILFTLRVFARNLQKGSRRRNILIFRFIRDV